MTRPASGTDAATLASRAARRFRGRELAQPATLQLRGERPAAAGPSRPSASSSDSAWARARTARSRWAATWSEATRSRGNPLWARPRTLPSLRSSKSFSASSNPSCSLGDGLEPGPRDLVGRVRHEDAERLDRAAPDATAQLVELGEPEPVGPLDDHHRRRRDVDPDLDDGRADEHVQLAVPEAGHLGVAFGRLHPAVDHARPAAARAARVSRTASVSAATAPVGLVGALLDERDDDERRVAERRLLADLAATSPRARPGGGSRSGSGRARPAACAGRTRRGRRTGPGRASAGSAWRSSAGRAASGRRPWPRAAPRWSTPKRCCSSMMTRPRSANETASWISACVPTTTERLPGRDRLERLGLRRPP